MNNVELNEQKFQDAITHWVLNNDKKSWDVMFNCIHFACSNIAKRIISERSVKCRNLDDRIMDATIYCMEGIKNKNHRPNKLSAYCYLRTLCNLQSKYCIMEDREITYSNISEEELMNNNRFESKSINEDIIVLTEYGVFSYADILQKLDILLNTGISYSEAIDILREEVTQEYRTKEIISE